MAVSLTLLPTNDNSDNSSSSNNNKRADSGSPASLPPPTPLSPHHPYHQHGNLSRPGTADSSGHNKTNANHNNANANGASANEKRKTSRRANTAERRATHNAVERQRRETLNGRFLDLANLLPNLTSVRRPSKSAIVNSSIAIIHSQRRSRALAARELVNLYNQFCALKAECDEWRARAGIPPVEEGERSSEWNALMEYAGTIKDCELEMGEEERGALRAAALASGGLGGSGSGGGMNGAIGLADDDEEDLVMPPGGGMMGLGLEDELPLPTPTSVNGSNPLLDGIDIHHHQHHAHHAAHHPHHIQHPAQHPNQMHHPMHQVAAAAAPMHKQIPNTTTTPTAAQLAHQQHLAQVYAQAQGNLQLAQQQMQWAQQQASANAGVPPPPSAGGGRGRSSTFSHLPAPQVQIHPLHTSAPHDIVSPFDNGSDLFHDSISILGGVPPSGMINAHHQPFHHGHHHHHGHITPPIKSEWPGFPTTTGTGATGGTGGMPTTYDESISSVSSGGSDAAQSPGAASSISGAASPVALTSASHVGRSRASSLNHGAVSAPVPVPIGGGGQGNMVMNMFY